MSNEPMTAAQHTPLPWTLEPTGQGVRWNRAGYITADDGKICVGYAYTDKTKMHVGEADANGRIMAAAPELLAACRTLADYYKGHEATDDQAAKEAGGGVYRALVAARAAIAKAEGKDGGQ